MTACKECGAAVPAETRFCPVCGKAVGEPEQYPSESENPEWHAADTYASADILASQLPPVSFKELRPEEPAPHEINPSRSGTTPTARSSQPVYTQPSYSQPPPAYMQPPVRKGYERYDPPPYGSPYAVMGTGSYIGLMILFRIPVIGFIACLIVSFAARNRNMRNFARAELVLAIIIMLILVAVFFIIRWFWAIIVENIENYFRNAIYNSIYNSVPELSDIFPELSDAFPELDSVFPGFDGTLPDYEGIIPGFDGTIPDNISLSDLLDILAGLGIPGYQSP